MRAIVFDTETTGIDPREGHRMVEIGCIELIDRVETGRHFHRYFNPERPMPPDAERVHGLSNGFLADKPLFAQVADELVAWLGDDGPLIAHNAGFDFGFVNAELARVGRPPLDPARMVDTAAMARKAHPGAKHSLDALCVRYGVDRSHRVKHGALLDAELLTHVWIEMTGGRQMGLGLSAGAVPSEQRQGQGPDAGDADPAARRPLWPGRTPMLMTVSPDEAARHAAFVATLTDPIWHRATAPGAR